MNRTGRSMLLVLCLGLAGCGGSRRAVEQAGLVADDTRRFERISDYSAPDVAQAAMGRKPDAVQHDGDKEIHYFMVKGATDGEALRLVYRDGKLVSRQVVQVAPGE